MHLQKSKLLFKFEFEPTLQEYPEEFRIFYGLMKNIIRDIVIHNVTGNADEIMRWINRLPVQFRYDSDNLIAITMVDDEFKVLDIFTLG